MVSAGYRPRHSHPSADNPLTTLREPIPGLGFQPRRSPCPTFLLSDGLSKPVEATIAVVAMIASFVVLSLAMKSLPLGTAYTIWTGIGAIGAFVIGIAVLGEAATAIRIGSAILILAGIIGLKLASD